MAGVGLDNAADWLHLLVEALVLFSLALDRWLHIPWPIPIAILFVPFTAALSVVVWWIRGMVIPVACGYPTTKPGQRCRRLTVGEWHKCWQHAREWRRRTDRHTVDPSLRRWQLVGGSGPEDDPNLRGYGFLRTNSRREGLLYHQGFARPPRDVFRLVPQMVLDRWRLVRTRSRALRKLGWRGLLISPPHATTLGVASVLPSVIWATRTTLLLVAAGLGGVIVSVPLPEVARALVEYVATFLLIGAVTVVRFGVVGANPRWVGPAVRQACRWILGLSAIAAVGGLLSLFGDALEHTGENLVRVLAETVFTGGAALLTLVALAIVAGGRRRRRRRSRSRGRLF